MLSQVRSLFVRFDMAEVGRIPADSARMLPKFDHTQPMLVELAQALVKVSRDLINIGQCWRDVGEMLAEFWLKLAKVANIASLGRIWADSRLLGHLFGSCWTLLGQLAGIAGVVGKLGDQFIRKLARVLIISAISWLSRPPAAQTSGGDRRNAPSAATRRVQRRAPRPRSGPQPARFVARNRWPHAGFISARMP